ncbi:Por secretion system C-terminal sorting domain-containing protein [Hymenobacter arizonensis]|uniref:Por secretion system C-terminal sorting domain-containing protein n=2 Tax=Hymenobacter arizonensis TaxID=1227077 RepID=A0A1I5WX06_HYMAR|nr:Por secretion system C-terminal sorting domain-containing protein [Hymenobacter arizonensis]
MGKSDGDDSSDYATLKYSPTGQQLWLARYSTPGFESAQALALDPTGNIYVTGSSQATDNASGADMLTVKYLQSAAPVCNNTRNQPTAGPDGFTLTAGSLTFTAAQLLANDSDPQGRPLQVSRVGTPSSGTLVRNSNGTYTFTPWAGFAGRVTIPYLIQENGPVLASSETYHYYEFVSAPGICWTDAQAAAAARRYQGMQGYLATITFAGEKEFLKGHAEGQYWFGASDDAVEGEWRWKTGPEAGQLIWRGGPNGIGAAYNHWLPGQPDDYKNQWRPQGEDYAQLYGNSSLWNDVDNCNTGGTTAGYVVEYGGLEACTPILYSLGTITITVGASAQARMVASHPVTAAAAGLAALEASPNPSTGQFRVRITAAGVASPTQLELFDFQGRRVRTLYTGSLTADEIREVPVDALDLSSGIYLLRLQMGKQVQNLRIQIQK